MVVAVDAAISSSCLLAAALLQIKRRSEFLAALKMSQRSKASETRQTERQTCRISSNVICGDLSRPAECAIQEIKHLGVVAPVVIGAPRLA